MTEEFVNIEVDGQPIKARKGAMLIEATDGAGIYIPRFCYHKKLSIAANCRMCLVQVEKAAKPLPACATPVMEGMKVQTRSAAAREAQKATMEFLLINHPLDCPICDQGGECELQDLAMGYGADVSRYAEGKRVVKDKDIGPLVQTEMTRCIHCTRCVRFGEEIAGVRELGATGRGENMEIGTYIERALTSEMSGNVIDLCPVGALTSKPFRFSARPWELRARPGVAPHDCIGSNIEIHVKGNVVKRVVPRENEAINEVWISDRDRFSYEGLYSEDRLTAPMIRDRGEWRETDWETALKFTAAALKETVASQGAEQAGVLASPNATVEELYLLQKLARALGLANIDHRLRQADFRGEDSLPLHPGLGIAIADLERVDAALIIGSNVRKDQPIANHRLRKAWQRGAALMAVNPVDFDFNWNAAQKLVVRASDMPAALGGVLRALVGESDDTALAQALKDVTVNAAQRAIAERLRAAGQAVVLLGNIAIEHPDYSVLRALAQRLAALTGARFGCLPPAANSAGAWLAGALPHRGPAGAAVARAGRNARQMFEHGCAAYLLHGLEPELDAADPRAALRALRKARFVAAFTAYRTSAMLDYAHVLLPIALFAETAGTYVNAEGAWQSFEAAVAPGGEARPGWKVLRVLGNMLGLEGFEYMQADEIRDELHALVGDRAAAGALPDVPPLKAAPVNGPERITEMPINAVDPLVRRAPALQEAAHADGALHVSAGVAQALGLGDGDRARIEQDGEARVAPVRIDARVAEGCVLVHGAGPLADLGPAFGAVRLEKA